jgi:excisionase family DNA binding protein
MTDSTIVIFGRCCAQTVKQTSRRYHRHLLYCKRLAKKIGTVQFLTDDVILPLLDKKTREATRAVQRLVIVLDEIRIQLDRNRHTTRSHEDWPPSAFAAAKPLDRRRLKVGQASEYLGIAVQTVYQWCSERKIPYYKVGSKTFFDADKLDAWRAKSEVKPMSEVVSGIKGSKA